MNRQDHLEVYDLTLTVWAPLFVGSGSKYTKKEYMFNPRSEEVSFLDNEKFFAFLEQHRLMDQYTDFMLSNRSNLWKFLVDECGIKGAELNPLKRYSVRCSDALDEKHSLKEIHAFQRDVQGRAYIPGSSIKGALRTVWLMDAVRKESTVGHSLREDKRAKFPEERYVSQLSLPRTRPEDAVNSIFRGIQVSDSGPIDNRRMIIVSKKDAQINGYVRPNQFPLCRECVAPGTSIRFKLTLDQSILKGRITKEGLEQMIRDFDAYYQQTYARRFVQPKDAAPLPQQPYLILGGGSGFFTKSLAYPYLGEEEGLRWTARQMSNMFRGHKHERDVEKGISPHTMKYARFNGRLYPYGYCGVSIT